MKKILIANRGEIALRIMRTAKAMGISSVAIYSEIDHEARHTLFADEAVLVGPAPSTESYLNMDKIIEEALRLGVDAIHPGYGFLSENAIFAQRVEEAGITFIGPSPESITIMGSKLQAKAAVRQYNIPMVPGTDEAVEDIAEAKTIAAEIGFPILIKASAGGGGKGMRVVENKEEFESQMDRAVSEAQNAFGDGSVFIEKYVGSPRHIEIQILADNHGNIVHLFERECSVQRRHQKVVEEAPSSVLTEELRAEMGAAAVLVAKSCDYSGAGTVEFLLDEHNKFYFLEMNTRLQVEHPVTELITGVDLVKQQIKIARNEVLEIKQEDLKIQGHAVELRVYAENPQKDFLPDIGTLEKYEIPMGENVRVDDAYKEGEEIPIYYDPMISKLITYADDRASAISKMEEAIENYQIEGIATTLNFGKFVMRHQAFKSGKFDTHFVKKYFTPAALVDKHEEKAAIIVALKKYLDDRNRIKSLNLGQGKWLNRKEI